MRIFHVGGWTISSMAIVLSIYLPVAATAQPAPIPYHEEPYLIDSGLHDGPIGPGKEPVFAFGEVIQVPDAPWLRLYFEAYNLRKKIPIAAAGNDSTGMENDTTEGWSYIIITSLEDGGRQRLDARSLPQWNNASAFFNGDAVEIELHVAPEDKGIFFRISKISVGERSGDSALGKTLEQCGLTDDRITFSDPAVGRIVPVGCTGWIASNGSHLTAGHCEVLGDMFVLEFSVPLSDPDGTINHPGPQDQYPIDQQSIVHTPNYNIGNDWAIFACGPNSNTGLLPVQAQQAFYRMSRDDDPETARVTGYGADWLPAGTPGGPCPNIPCTGFNDCNSSNQTLQTDAGDYIGENVQGASDVVIEYIVDTECGNSGSPVIIEGTTVTIGIHTNAGCDPPDDGNQGTGFENDDLESAIQDFPGANVEYADKDHPVTEEDGTVFRPYDTVGEAVTAVSSGGIVSIVEGYYNETMTVSKAMTITAPVGTVTIGASGMGKVLAGSPVATASAPEDSATGGLMIPTEYALSPAYPNPFNPSTTIKYALKDEALVSLRVYDLLGREVRVLVNEQQPAAYHSVVWDGRDASGRLVPSGIYITRLVTPEFTAGIKMVLLK